MKFALCNEMFERRTMAQVCSIAKQLSYHGIEIAPFTLAESAEDITYEQRVEVRKIITDSGLETVGLHWLFAGPDDLHITTPNNRIWDRTVDYFCILLDLCSDLGGKVLVLGSPKQRSLVAGQTKEGAWKRAVDLFENVLDKAREQDLTICLEPLSPVETDFINTVAEGMQMVRRLDHPNFKIHLDVKAMCSESKPRVDSVAGILPANRGRDALDTAGWQPQAKLGDSMSSSQGEAVANIIRSVRAEDIGHFHVNDPNLYGPGMGDVDYAPIAQAIKDIGWNKWLSVEVFKYDPDPETIARKSIEYIRSYF